ncbi:hypothetical protein KSP39_PZI020018 [Platanthera zijinensis]|uniref:Uncharacterized protein n=1 Tax=Platanthera zijinensis TaxID=2320716 RepID=A0AAP0B070_9ASPA
MMRRRPHQEASVLFCSTPTLPCVLSKSPASSFPTTGINIQTGHCIHAIHIASSKLHRIRAFGPNRGQQQPHRIPSVQFASSGQIDFWTCVFLPPPTNLRPNCC